MPNQNEQAHQKSEQDRQIMKNLLKSLELFKELNEEMLNELIEDAIMDYYPENKIIFNEGESGDCMYIIKSGIVRIYHAGETSSFDQEIAMLGDNDFFGEMALISEAPRNATAKTTEATQVFIIKKSDFLDLISTNPAVAEKISKEFLDRVKANTREKNA